MRNIGKKSEKIIDDWFSLLVPKSLTVKELEALAEKSMLSYDLLQKIKSRRHKNITIDTLIKLALARGYSLDQITSGFTIHKKMSKSELEWIKFGKQLTNSKREQFLEFLTYMKDRWNF